MFNLSYNKICILDVDRVTKMHYFERLVNSYIESLKAATQFGYSDFIVIILEWRFKLNHFYDDYLENNDDPTLGHYRYGNRIKNRLDEYKPTIISAAITYGQLDIFNTYYDQKNIIIDHQHVNMSAKSGNLAMVRRTLELVKPSYWSSKHLYSNFSSSAVESGNIDIVRLAVELNIYNKHKKGLLLLAVTGGFYDIFEWIMDKMERTKEKKRSKEEILAKKIFDTDQYNEAFIKACEIGYIKIVKKLMFHIDDYIRMRGLYQADQYGFNDIIELLSKPEYDIE